MTDPFSPLTLAHGPDWSNRFMLAPLTNLQSHADGVMSEDEFTWLSKRGEGGFGAVSTCASHVSERGIGFPGQMGIWGDHHLDGLSRLAEALNRAGSHSIVQLHHAGMRTPQDLIDGPPECPSDSEKHGAKALSADGVERLKDDFIAAARRAKTAGFHGVELHGAHGYILGQFISPTINKRTDKYGGPLENRARILFDLIERVREDCGPDFSLGVRLSPERFGMVLSEMVSLVDRLFTEQKIDYLDLSLWDVFKMPAEDAHADTPLLDHFTRMERGRIRFGAAGKISTAADVRRALEAGLDFVVLGRSGILHHDFPRRMRADSGFEPVSLPVSREHLKTEGLGPKFIDYMSNWDGFVEEEA